MFGGALEQLNRQRKIAALHGGAPALDQVISLHVGGRRRRAGCSVLDRETLAQVREDGLTEGVVIHGTGRGQFVLMDVESSGGSECAAVERVSSLIFGIVALERERRS